MGADEIKQPMYVCVHVPEFPAQALLRLRPDLARTPVAVLAGDAPLEQTCSANPQAFRLGVTQGMTRAELDSFAGLTLLRRSLAEERSARAVLLEAAGAFTPRIEFQPSNASVCNMVLDMTGTTRIFGPASQAVDAIARTLSTLGFSVQLATSTNLHAAVCSAPAARTGPIVIPPGNERHHLHHLPLTALNLTPQQAETLTLWGLHTLGELASLPAEDLVVRLGQPGKRLHLLARGEHPSLMVPEEPVFTLEEFLGFEAPIELLDSLLFVLGPMLDQLLARAQNRALALASVTLKLGLDGGGEHVRGAQHVRTVKPALPVLDRTVLLKLLHLDLQAYPPPSAVTSVFVHAEPGDRSKVQLGLFAPQLPEPLRLDVTLARIAALVGEDRVGRARLLDVHRPDSFVMERFTVSNAKTKHEANTRQTTALRRCRPPIKLSVKHEGQRIVSFFLHGKLYTVEQAYGPWRRSGEWWSSQVWSREELDVRATTQTNAANQTNATTQTHATTQTGETLLCLITHDLLRHHWQLEAVYD